MIRTSAGPAADATVACPFRAGRSLSYRPNQYVFHQGDPTTGLYCLKSGLVALQRLNEKGDLIIFRLLKPGAVFSSCDLFEEVHRNSAQALTATSLCWVDRDSLLGHTRTQPAALAGLLRIAFDEARASEDEVFRLYTFGLQQRIVFLLAQMADDLVRQDAETVTFCIPVKRKDLAAMAGTSPEVLSRTIRRLENSGVAKFDGQRVTLWRNRLECDTAAQLQPA